MEKHALLSILLLLELLVPCLAAYGGLLRDRIEERRESRRAATTLDDAGVRLPREAQLERDVSYGSDPQQRLDIYIPGQANTAPVILMVHGGAWMVGDKAAAAFVSNKIAHWLPKGYILVSSNYRMSRRPNPLQQADDIARALAFVQTKASSWGGTQPGCCCWGTQPAPIWSPC